MSLIKQLVSLKCWVQKMLSCTFYQSNQLIKGELAHLLSVSKSPRPWHLPIVMAISISFPVFVGVYFGALSAGIKASLGAMIILNLPLIGSLPHRLMTIIAWGFAMSMSFALGAIAQQLPYLRLPVFALIAFAVIVFGRYYHQPPPAGLFIMTAGAIALFIPIPLDQVMPATGMVMFGSIFSTVMALLYSLFLLSTRLAQPAIVYSYQPDTLSESFIVAGFVSLTLLIAIVFNMTNPYWAAVSCFIIIQGIHLRTMWIRQFHRLLGTLIGIGLAGWMLSWHLSSWQVAVAILVMMVSIESLIDRHYGLAVIFITPLTIFIAEYGSGLALTETVYQQVMRARFLDTALGCLLGILGGWVMHSTQLRLPFQRLERWLLKRFGTKS